MRAISFVAAVMVATSACAESTAHQKAQKAADEVMDKAIGVVTLGYFCEDALGKPFYYAARDVAIQAFKALTPDQDKALLLVDEAMKRIIAQKPKKAPTSFAAHCTDKMLEAKSELEVALAKFRMAAAIDK